MQSHLDYLKPSVHLTLSLSKKASRKYHSRRQKANLFLNADRRAYADAMDKPPSVSDVRAHFFNYAGLIAAPLGAFGTLTFWCDDVSGS